MTSAVAGLRMKALRLEENEDWLAASVAWHDAIDALKLQGGPFIKILHSEFEARALAAQSRADEPMAAVQSLDKVETRAKTDEKSDAERTPSAVTHLDAGPTQGDTGAR
jgi:hypothetical protein